MRNSVEECEIVMSKSLGLPYQSGRHVLLDKRGLLIVRWSLFRKH